jgi:serine/threonine protein kinase/WD40 repeat protein
MNGDRWRRVDELFQEVIALPAPDRDAVLDRVGAGDPELVREVRTLLGAHDHAGDFLEAPAQGGVSSLLGLDTGQSIEDLVGSRLGAYRITRAIASGGMGAVYLASRDDDEFRKTVAIKIVRRGLLGSTATRRDQLLQRFQLERQALATLDHPNIAGLLDGGTSEDGRPYLVMEYVEGELIDAYCLAHRLGVRQKLDLMSRVCSAVQHAHRNLIIHRDLKPGNVLVTPEGEPKLLDFGLAKLLNPTGEAFARSVTGAGEFMGTFAYAAPEQIAETGSRVDTRSDVYALGMILYRLLTGEHPYDVSGPVALALERITKQTPEPPSARDRAIDNELDTIVLKAVAKDPARRYQSAGDLQLDIERYLRGEAISAKADSGWYVLRKTMRRYRAPLSVVGVFVLLIAGFAVIATSQASGLARQKTELERALRLSNIERARVMGMAGSGALAETILWSEHLARPGDPVARWALWEFYMGQPCRRRIHAGLSSVTDLAASPDGRWLALRDGAGAGVVLDLETGADAFRFKPTQSGSHAIEFCRRSGALVYENAGGGIERRSVPDGATLPARWDDLDEPTTSIDAVDDRLAIATAGRIRVRSDPDGVPLWDHRITSSAINVISLQPGGDLMAAGLEDGRVLLLDMSGRTPERAFFEVGLPCRRLCFSPDGRFLAASVRGVFVAVIDVDSGLEIARLDDLKDWVQSLQFRPGPSDPHLLAGASFGRSIVLWEIPSGRAVQRLHAFDAPVRAMRFSADGDRLYSANDTHELQVWETEPLAGFTNWKTAGAVFDLKLTTDARRLLVATGDPDTSAWIYDSASGEPISRLGSDASVLSSLAISPAGDRVAFADDRGTLRCWSFDGDAFTLERWRRDCGEGIGPRLNSVSWSIDGQRLAVCGNGPIVEIRSAVDGALLERRDLGCTRIPSLRYSPDGQCIVVATMGPSTITRLDARTGERAVLWGGEADMRIVRFSPDGSLLAGAGDDRIIRLWSMRDHRPGRPTTVLEGHSQDIFALAFTPDARLIASSGRDGVIKLWDTASGRCLATLPGRRDMVFALAFAPDGRTLYSGSRDNTIGVWNLAHYDRHIEGNLESRRAALAIPPTD